MRKNAIWVLTIFAILGCVLWVSGCQNGSGDGDETATTVIDDGGSSETTDGADDREESTSEDGNNTDKENIDQPGTNEEGASGGSDSAAGPSLTIAGPAPGSIVVGPKVKVELGVSAFNLVDKLGKASLKGEGHIHYIVDGGSPVPSFLPTAELELAPGKHTLKVELHNNDHTPLSPVVEASTEFTVK